MHWYNIFAVVGGIAVGVLSYFGARSGVIRQIGASEHARAEDHSREHDRWLRERRAEIYLDVLTWRSRRRLTMRELYAKVEYGLDDDEPSLEETAPIDSFLARLLLYGSDQSVRLVNESMGADVEVITDYVQWVDATSDPAQRGAAAALRQNVEKALAVADGTHNRLTNLLRDELSRATSSGPAKRRRQRRVPWPRRPVVSLHDDTADSAH